MKPYKICAPRYSYMGYDVFDRETGQAVCHVLKRRLSDAWVVDTVEGDFPTRAEAVEAAYKKWAAWIESVKDSPFNLRELR